MKYSVITREAHIKRQLSSMDKVLKSTQVAQVKKVMDIIDGRILGMDLEDLLYAVAPLAFHPLKCEACDQRVETALRMVLPIGPGVGHYDFCGSCMAEMGTAVDAVDFAEPRVKEPDVVDKFES
jgi:hypothetical protein